MQDFSHLTALCKLVRHTIIASTSKAGSGHPTSSLSAVELMVVLFFGGYLRFDLNNPRNVLNDRVIFSKGHAAPLLYSLHHAAGALSHEEILRLRSFTSELEGHPSPRFRLVDVATGSLGQGLSIGVGMALGAKLQANQKSTIWVLMGDSETAEGQIWEALAFASYYKLNNLTGIIDVNRLGQRGETMLGWDLAKYEKRADSFGWNSIVVQDGHDLKQVYSAFEKATENKKNGKPTMIIAKTIKGKGVSFLEDKNGWHGVPVPKDKLELALKELGDVDLNVRGKVTLPSGVIPIVQPADRDRIKKEPRIIGIPPYARNDQIATREAYGDALVALGKSNSSLIVMDAEVSNSTYANKFAKAFPERFFEMFIAEQNMISAALGLSKMGYLPFVSTFSVFLTRSFDQLRMAQYSNPNLKVVGSHSGVSIGQDGPSQMGLEDIAMMRSLLESTVLYPSDAVSAFKLTHLMASIKGISYLRTTREKTPIIYPPDEEFKIGGSKIVRQSKNDKAVVVAAGITLHEALKAYDVLKRQGLNITVVDLYSIKPADEETLLSLAKLVKYFIVVEDHYPFGGVGDVVTDVLCNENVTIERLAVKKIPRSGTPEELRSFEEIDPDAIVKKVQSPLLSR
ncbi:transketolase [Candidatus Roizmanbacteria bacterium]|nr:transketolase [Candidatus Roizmanbacteria bacterium]